MKSFVDCLLRKGKPEQFFALVSRCSRVAGKPALLLMVLVLVAGCGSTGQATRLPGAIYREETVALPTSGPSPEPSPVNTRVLPLESFTPEPTGTVTPIPDQVRGLVVDVVDGDTISVVLDGDAPGHAYQVRYIGVTAPSTDTAWGVVAQEVNRKLTNMKVARLVRDETDFDDEGNLLRYVYIGEQLMSVILAEQGLVRADITEPNSEFRAEILEAEARAREAGLGLWGPPPTATPGRNRATISTPVRRATETSPVGTPAVEESPSSATGSPIATGEASNQAITPEAENATPEAAGG